MGPAEYASALKRSEEDNAEFDALVERLRSDKQIDEAGMREIANQFVGYAPKKSRTEVLKTIVQWQSIGQRQRARGRNIDKWAGKTW